MCLQCEPENDHSCCRLQMKFASRWSAILTLEPDKSVLSVRCCLSDFRGQQPQEQIPDGHRLVLSCTSYQCVRSLKPVGTFDLHLPIFLRTRPNNRHTPLPRAAAQNVFNNRLNFPSDRGITRVMQLDQDRHFFPFYKDTSVGGPSSAFLRYRQ